MKKTLITLLALGSVAIAGEDSITLSTARVKDSSTTSLISSYTEGIGQYNKGEYISKLIGDNKYETLTFNINVSQLYSSSAVALQEGESLSLVSFAYWVNSVEYLDTNEGRVITLNNGSQSVSSAVYSTNYDNTTHLATITFEDEFLFTTLDTITVTMSPDVGKAFKVSYFDTKDGAAITGVDELKTLETQEKVNKNWKYNAVAVQLTAERVPEPATGSLSLLALAGLCARRRRK